MARPIFNVLNVLILGLVLQLAACEVDPVKDSVDLIGPEKLREPEDAKIDIPIDNNKEAKEAKEAKEEPKEEPKVGETSNFVQDIVNLCTAKAKKFVSKIIKPTQDYVALIRRYHEWYKSYTSIYEIARKDDDTLLSASDLMSIKFAQVDKELYEELYKKAEERVNSGEKRLVYLDEIENMDYLYEALLRLIKGLELALHGIQNEGIKIPSSVITIMADDGKTESRLTRPDPKEIQEFKKATQRVRSIAINTAQRVVLKELAMLGFVYTFDSMATYLSHNPPAPGSSLSYLSPLIYLLGSADESFVVSYLTNIQMRAAMSIIDGYNPLPGLLKQTLDKMKG